MTKMTDAEVEQVAQRLVDGMRKSANRHLWAEMLGEPALASFTRLCERMMPEIVRFHAAEINAGTTAGDVGAAMSGFAAWMIANWARNTNDPRHALELQLAMVTALGMMLTEHAKPIDGATLGEGAP